MGDEEKKIWVMLCCPHCILILLCLLPRPPHRLFSTRPQRDVCPNHKGHSGCTYREDREKDALSSDGTLVD